MFTYFTHVHLQNKMSDSSDCEMPTPEVDEKAERRKMLLDKLHQRQNRKRDHNGEFDMLVTLSGGLAMDKPLIHTITLFYQM